MEIFEKIGDAASKTYKYTAEKTSKIAKETKLKMKINECKKEIETIYKEIGEAVYEKFIVNEEVSKEELTQRCEEINVLTEKIVECKDEILNLKEKKQCKNCYEEIELVARYCPNCGCEQEVVETSNNEDIEVEEAETEESHDEEEN